MTHRPFDPVQTAPACVCATGIESAMRGASRRMRRFVVATHSLA